MSPEVHILGLNLVFFTVCYWAIYPRMEPKTLRRMTMIDLVLIAVLLGIAGSVYMGQGVSFTLLFFETRWWVFTLVTALVVELPFFFWFCRKWGIDLNEWDDSDD